MSKQQAQRSMTSSEFVEMIAYLEYIETEVYTRQEYFLANIARSLFQVNSEKGKEVPIEPFLLKFKPDDGSSKTVKRELTEQEKYNKMAVSKGFWMSFVHSSKKK